MIDPLKRYAHDIASQSGEDGIIAHILSRIGDGSRVAAEFGAADGRWFSNTWALGQVGWRRFLFDGNPRNNPQVLRHVLTAENINEVFDEAGVPEEIDVLSIDVDGNDFYLWHTLKRSTRIVVIEYNASLPPTEAYTIAYNPTHTWDGTNYFGASLYALYLLGQSKGMRLVHSTMLNGIFVAEEEAERAGLVEASPYHKVCYNHPIATAARRWVRVVPPVSLDNLLLTAEVPAQL